MYKAKIFDTKETKEGTWLKVLIPHESKTDEINRLIPRLLKSIM